MAKRFLNKKVLITGASSGIGAALALEFAKEGADIILCARRQELLEKVAAQVLALNQKSLVVACDVTRPETLEKAVEKAVCEFGKIDVAIANAGFGIAELFQELKVEDFRRQLETNFFGVLNTIYAVLPQLKISKGQLVLLGSITGRVGYPTCSAYSASKFAVNGLAECLYYDLAEDDIDVTWINPGIVQSDISRVDNQGVYHPERKDPRPAKLMMKTEVAARKMVRGIYKKESEIIITGHGKVMVWLSRWMPKLWRFLFRAKNRGKLQEFKASRRQQQ